jgi:protein-S-isoprenylcysteine O-methyltransferase Ste14
MSVLLRRRAIATLGRMWSFHVEIRGRHELIVAGPFRWMRHPAYCSMLLEYAAVLVLLRSYLSFALSMLFFLPAYVQRIKLEERALVEAFGARYEAYRARTPMLIPYKIPSNADGAAWFTSSPARCRSASFGRRWRGLRARR